jgi:chondroitin 4-sulfotransferase 11
MFATETRKSLVTEEQWNSYFKFAFVRNPWDWLVSTYNNIHQSYNPEVLKQNIFIADKQFILDTILSELNLTKDQLTFKVFLRDCVLDQRVENPFDYHWKDQHVHVCNRQGKIMVDFLGRFEQITQDIVNIADRIGLDLPIPHLNKTAHQEYRNFYDDESRSWVEKRFERDITLFNYSF